MPFCMDKLPNLIERLVHLANESDAGVVRVAMGSPGTPEHKAIIIVDAGPNTQEVLDAVGRVENSWE